MTLTRRETQVVEAFVREHQAGVRRFLVFLGCPRELVDDLVQEVFLSVLDSPFEERDPASSAAYLRQVARHRLIKVLERERRKPMALDPEQAELLWARFERDDGGESYLDALRECVRSLTGRSGEVILLRYRQGLAREAIAEQLGLTEAGVKSILVRARAWLRACVERKVA